MMTRADWILLTGIVLCLPLLYTEFWFNHGHAEYLRVQRNSQDAQILPLYPDRQLQLEGPLGESVIELQDGRARFLKSPCHGQYCVRNGWLTTAGELAACLPNRISIQLLGRHPRFDAINF